MNIIVKELEKENHIYLMDHNMSPISIDVVVKTKTENIIKKFYNKFRINSLFVSKEKYLDLQAFIERHNILPKHDHCHSLA